jgi:Ca-activated chloride channel family protein
MPEDSSPVWGSAELAALLDGAIAFDRAGVAFFGVAAVLALALAVLLAGPRRIRVPRPRASARSRWPRPDFAWALSILLRAGALAGLVTALARPIGLIPENPAGGVGVDLVVALDASGSMEALDAELDGRRTTRLELARRAVADFVRARDGDRIGLVVFGAHAFTQCPLSVDHRLLLESLERAEPGVAGDSTAIGEAIGLATRRLRVAGAPEDARRVIVLVTDGRHNAGSLAPETAAQVARSQDVRIHTVGIGTQGSVPFAPATPGQPLRFERVDLDQETLRRIADSTGGRYFHAERPEDLLPVIAAIDALEARPLPADPRYRRASLAPLAFACVLALLLLEATTAHGVLRRLP